MHCRLCLYECNNKKSINIFENNEKTNWAQLIQKYFCIEVKSNDAFSTKLCESCFNHLQDFVNFVQHIEQRQQFLEDVQMNQNTKDTSLSVKSEPLENEFFVEESQSQSFYISEVNETPDETSSNVCSTVDQFILPNFNSEKNDVNGSQETAEPKNEIVESDIIIETNRKRQFNDINVETEQSTNHGGIEESAPFKRSRIQQSPECSEKPYDLMENSTICKNTNHNTVEKRLNGVEKKLNTVLNNQHKILAILERLTVDDFSTKVFFPVRSAEEITKIEAAAGMELDKFVQILRHIIQPDGLISNFSKILSDPVLNAYNYDGVNGKNSFKDLKSFNKALFEASFHEGYTQKDYVRDIRLAFRQNKKRIFKKEFDSRRKEQNKGQQSQQTTTITND